MCAFLYIISEMENSKERYPENGFFLDRYNGSCVLWTLGLSWYTDILPCLDDFMFLSVEDVKELYEYILTREQVLPSREELKANYCHVADSGNGNLQWWHQYFKDKRVKLIRFLEHAILLNEPIWCKI